jgi:dTDP-glucose 4,6-dehydratase
METMVITGVAGFIGSNFVRLARKETSSRLVVVDKLTYAGTLKNLEGIVDDDRIEFVQADIKDAVKMQEVFRNFQPTSLVNFAAETHVDRSIENPSLFIETNVLGTGVLLETTRTYLAQCNLTVRKAFRFLHISTDEVYGTLGASGRFSEDTPYAPNSPYSASKAGADHLVRSYYETFKVPTLTTNCSNNYGPFQFPEKLIPLVILNALEARSIPIYGDGMNIRDWLYVEDHCEALLRVLEGGVPGQRYNIGGDCERSNVEIVDGICQSLEMFFPASSNPACSTQKISQYSELKTFVPDRPGHDRRYAIDPHKIQTELGWTPRRTVEDGLRQTVHWYLQHQDWCQSVLHEKYDRTRLGLTMAGVGS